MPDQASNFHISIPARGLIRVGGPDRAAFLQGLVTADINALPQAGVLYGCLLNAQGKFLHDMFFHHTDEEILIDCEGGTRAEDLFRRLRMYKLRAPVTLDLVPENAVYAVSAGGVPDPRHPDMGQRSFIKPADSTEAPLSVWDERRIRLGIPDGSRDMAVEKDTLLDCNIDRFNGVSFGKGCYVGQEVTARMNYRGTAKKHLYPVEWREGTPPPAFTDVTADNGALIGQMRGACGARGLMQIRDDRLAALRDQPELADSLPFFVLM